MNVQIFFESSIKKDVCSISTVLRSAIVETVIFLNLCDGC